MPATRERHADEGAAGVILLYVKSAESNVWLTDHTERSQKVLIGIAGCPWIFSWSPLQATLGESISDQSSPCNASAEKCEAKMPGQPEAWQPCALSAQVELQFML